MDFLNNYDFLNALNHKQNFAAKEQAKQNEMALMIQMQNFKQQDIQNNLAQQSQVDQAKAYVNSLPMLPKNKAELHSVFSDMDKELKNEIDTKFNGNVNDFMNSYTGKQFMQQYKQKATSLPQMAKWTENKINADAIEKAAASGMEILPIYNNGKWYDTPEEQMAAFESGAIDKIDFSGAVKPKETDLQKHFAGIIAPTETLDEARSNTRGFATPQTATQVLMEKQYPMLQNGSEHYKRLYNKYFDMFEKQFENPNERLYYKPYQSLTAEEKQENIDKRMQIAFANLNRGVKMDEWRMNGGVLGNMPDVSSENPAPTTFAIKQVTQNNKGEDELQNVGLSATLWTGKNPYNKAIKYNATYAYTPDEQLKTRKTTFKGSTQVASDEKISKGENVLSNIVVVFPQKPTFVSVPAIEKDGKIIPDASGQGKIHTFVMGTTEDKQAVTVPYELSPFAESEKKDLPTTKKISTYSAQTNRHK